MPFSMAYDLYLKLQKIIKKALGSLQVSRRQIKNRFLYFISNKKLKRVFSFTSQKGSITLEAAIVTSIFMFTIVSFIGILCILEMQQNIQIALENTGRRAAQNFYYGAELRKIGESSKALEKMNTLLKEKSADLGIDRNVVDEKIEGVAFQAYIYTKFLSEINPDEINKSYVAGGIAGLDFRKSRYDSDTGTIDIVLDYRLKIPYLSENVWTISDIKRVYVKEWSGKDIVADSNIVYITKTGSVYHLTKECSHLNLSIIRTDYKHVKNMKNDSGSLYVKCQYCGRKNDTNTDIVYVTKYGAHYHATLSCGGINRSVIAIEMAQIGDRELCKDCGGQKIDADSSK